MEDPTPGRRYRLVSKATGYELAVDPLLGGAEIAHVVPIEGGWGVTWELEAADVGFRLTTRLFHPWTAARGDNVGRLDSNAERQAYVHRPNDGAYQRWRMFPDGDGFEQLVSEATGFALDGTDQDIYTMRPNDGAYQRWGFIPA
jgi:hypothetical protein